MAGIYIHIPFCRQACSYCDFHFSTLQKNRPAFVVALNSEIRLRKNFFPPGTQIRTLYFGGGTPGILNADELNEILENLHANFDLSGLKEFTLEVNPDDITYEKLEVWNSAGVNRLSIGIQSFRDEDLKLLNRAHDAVAAIEGVIMAKESGFQNITIDLMFGLPGLSLADWENNLRKAIHLNVPHISVYALSVEEKTRLAHEVKTKKVIVADEEAYATQFTLMTDLLSAHGYRQYEISNFARGGFESRHNSSYWLGYPYLGLGPSAHSFDLNVRSWNVANNSRYAELLKTGNLAIEESETLTGDNHYNEFLMTRLRLDEGLDVDAFREIFGTEIGMDPAAKKYMDAGMILIEDNRMKLSRAGKIISDAILRDLFR